MNLSTLTRPALALAVGAGLLGLAAPAASAHGDHDDHGGATSSSRLTHRERTIIKKATHDLRTPEAAVAAGFQATDACVELPGVGGMGYHYANLDNVFDGVIDPRKPEVLVFVPTRGGGRTLGAVEYFQVDGDQDASTDPDRPSLFGRYPFEGPMLGHEPGQPIHYDKHVWLYRHNPAGQLEPWNPKVHCPAG
jgi:hypothetical protein